MVCFDNPRHDKKAVATSSVLRIVKVRRTRPVAHALLSPGQSDFQASLYFAAGRSTTRRSGPLSVVETNTYANINQPNPLSDLPILPDASRPMLPIVIADDSLLARKLLTKALPPDWDVDVSYATNGREALALYREGKASVMFLDLTMPDMTGYDVLEALRHEELNTFVIVVSADVQPLARARVRGLGAIAFIAKPVTPETVLPILKEYGLYA
jgi:CheY-like chemotaxis protein